jgi:hypothetical protein
MYTIMNTSTYILIYGYLDIYVCAHTCEYNYLYKNKSMHLHEYVCIQVAIQICKFVADTLEITPTPLTPFQAPIQHLAEKSSWKLLSDENCFQDMFNLCLWTFDREWYYKTDEKDTIPLADTYEQCLLYVRNTLKKILKKNPITLEVMWENWYLNQEKKYGNVKYGNDQNTVKSEIEKKNIILNDIINNVEKGIFIKNEGPTAVISGVYDLNKKSENYSDHHDSNNDNNDNNNDDSNDDRNDNHSTHNNHHNTDNDNNHDHDNNDNNENSCSNGLNFDIDVSIDHGNDSDHINYNGNHINHYDYHNNDNDHNNNHHNNDNIYDVYGNMNGNNNSYNDINLNKHDDSIINDVRSRTRSTSIGKWNQVFEQIKSIGDDDELAGDFIINPMGLNNKPKVSKNGVLDNLEDDDFFFSNPMISPVSCIYIYKCLSVYVCMHIIICVYGLLALRCNEVSINIVIIIIIVY